MTPREIDERIAINRGDYTAKQFVDFNMEQYHICKNDDTRLSFDVDLKEFKSSHGYFIISIEWMSIWRAFVNGRGNPPG